MLDILVKTTILLVLVSVAAHLLRRRTAALRHLLWTFALVALVVVPLLSAFAPFQLRILPASVSSALPGSGGAVARTEQSPSSPSVEAAVVERATQSNVPPTTAASPAFTLPSVDSGTLWLGVWAFGVLLLLGRFALGFRRVSRIAHRAPEVTDESWLQLADRAAHVLGVSGTVVLKRSEDVAMPFACGLVNPIIVLPASADEWTAERREAVLMHEFAHISRGDLAMNTVSHVARALYWFHPLAWLAAYRLRVEGERACDDAVLRSGARPSDYAEHLLSIVRSVGSTVPNVALAMARRSDFEGRLLAILEPGVPRGKLTRLRAAGLAALFLGAVTPLAAMAPAASPNETLASIESSPVETTQQEPQGRQTPRPSQAPKEHVPQEHEPESSQGRERASSQENTAAVNALIETLSDANVNVRLVAVQSLGQLEDPRAIAALAKALKEDTDARVREAAAHSLGEIDDTRAVPHLLEALKTERVAAVKAHIVDALKEIDDAQAVSAVSALARDPSIQVRRAVASALGEFEDPAAIPALTSMVRDEDREVRQNVANALGQFDNSSTMEALTILARDIHHDVRQQAISGLSDLEDMRSLSTFIAALKDAHPDVRQQAADAIHNIDGLTNAPPALIEALRDENREVRKQVAHALGSIGDAAAVPALKRAVADPDTDVRRHAVEALKEIGGAEALEALLGLLKDPDPEIRKTAAEALGRKR
jgi:HEAT repeat protein/beta-lactamase regulating signal transducer with metallopeptidase domain